MTDRCRCAEEYIEGEDVSHLVRIHHTSRVDAPESLTSPRAGRDLFPIYYAIQAQQDPYEYVKALSRVHGVNVDSASSAAQGLCAVCAHIETSHVGCGADCDQCPGETSCEECMRADWYGSSDLHFFEAQ